MIAPEVHSLGHRPERGPEPLHRGLRRRSDSRRLSADAFGLRYDNEGKAHIAGQRNLNTRGAGRSMIEDAKTLSANLRKQIVTHRRLEHTPCEAHLVPGLQHRAQIW